MHHYLFEIGVSDKDYLLKLRDKLLEKGCSEKFSGDLNIYYATIYLCSGRVVIVGFKDYYYVDVLSNSEDIHDFIGVLTSVFPKNKIMLHYVIRSI